MGREIRFVGYALVIASLAMLTVIQFVPSYGLDEEAFGGSFEVNAYPWGLESSSSGFAGASSEDSSDWFEAAEDSKEDGEPADGMPELQAQMVIGYIGLGIGALGLLYSMFVSDNRGSLAVMFGGILVMVALILFDVGIGKLNDAASGFELTAAAGFGMYIAAVATMIIGGAAINRA